MQLLLAGAMLAAVGLTAVAAPTAAAPPASVASASAGVWQHAYAAFGEPKYPAGFDHFDYADPNARRGGTLTLSNPDLRSSFDKFNPYTIKGQAPAGVAIFMIETLAIPSGDEPSTMYGLVAEAIKVAPDKSSVEFHINPKARFSNGDPVTAADVKFVFDSLTGQYAAPAVRTPLAGVSRAELVDDLTIRFALKDHTIDTVNQVALLPVFSHKWGLGPKGEQRHFDEIINDYPIATGPYKIAATDSGRRIDFEYRPDYWAKDLGVRRGFFNFDKVVYRYYRDGAVAMEAFKAHEFDLLQEYSANRWDRVHAGPKWRDRRILKEVFPSGTGIGMDGYLPNLRRPIFADSRVRQALDLAYDFEWVNKRGQYKRVYSMFSNTQFAAQGLPSPGELKLLEPFRAELPAAVFGLPYVPPRTDTGPNALRQNLLKARDLLKAAGYSLGADGVMTNAQGLRLEFEFMTAQPGQDRTASAWVSNLQKLGIVMKIRLVDYALYIKRTETFDFDIVGIRSNDFTLPSALILTDILGSKAADETGSGNLRGVKSKAVDALLIAMGQAKTMAELQDACRALDRIVMQEHWQIPSLYAANFRVSYWNRFERPKTLPLYYQIDYLGDDYLPLWPIETWWLKPGAP
jgi:peptide/nickel transport system substrate-binding protein/microcin C transport system substrate-binding protein